MDGEEESRSVRGRSRSQGTGRKTKGLRWGNIKLKTSKAAEKNRLRYVLSTLPPEIIVERLKSAVATNVQARTALALVFDKKSFPPKSKARCTRCGDYFDPNYKTDEDCKDVQEHHMDSRYILYECAKCEEEWESLPDAIVDFG